jgi:signal peptidase I
MLTTKRVPKMRAPFAILVVVCVLIAFGYLRRFDGVTHSTQGLSPTFPIGSMLFLEELGNPKIQLRRWDVVCFCEPTKQLSYPMLLRVVGLPGESLQIGSDGGIRIDGKVISTPTEIAGVRYVDAGILRGNYTINADGFFLLGDSPSSTLDSRHFGEVPSGLISHRAIKPW